ncbi:MAG: hypothetical protein R3B72_15815 [Polyangiaceae bacterium]
MKRPWITGLSLLTLTLAGMGACSASNNQQGTESGTGAGTGTGDGSGAGTGFGGFSGTGGSGGDEACQTLDVEAIEKSDEADIIFVIDTSGSMVEENNFVRQHMNAFSQQIVSSGVDARVIMLAEEPPFFCGFCPGICIDPPLGSGNCPGDENPPNYFHPSSDIGSTDALSQIVDLYPSYGPNLRQASHKYLVIVTDDNASAPNIDDAQAFMTQFVGLDPPKLTGITVHAIYCFDGNGPCVEKGQAYEDLVNMTNGIHGNLALQDFQPIFNDVASQVIDDAALPCQYPVPAPPDGQALDPNKVNVKYIDGGGTEHTIYQVPGFTACDPVQGGWYYDDPNAPTTILLCPASCDFVSPDAQGRVNILFGCATEVLTPD